MISTIKKYTLPLMAYALPVVAAAQITVEQDVTAIDETLQSIYNLASGIIVTLIIIYILYGAFKFATAGGNEEKRKDGQNIMLYGLVGLVIVGSLLAIVNFVVGSVSFDTAGTGKPQPQQF